MDLPWNVDESAAVIEGETSTIYLAIPFFNLVDQGADSRAGTLVHELTHQSTVGSTKDYAYGETKAKALALLNPAKARGNADNYEYYLEDVFFGL